MSNRNNENWLCERLNNFTKARLDRVIYPKTFILTNNGCILAVTGTPTWDIRCVTICDSAGQNLTFPVSSCISMSDLGFSGYKVLEEESRLEIPA